MEKRSFAVLLKEIEQWVADGKNIRMEDSPYSETEYLSKVDRHNDKLAALAHKFFDGTARIFATADEIATARYWHGSDHIEFDDVAVVSETNEGGRWVQGWLWVYDDDMPGEDDEEDDDD